MPVQNQCNIMTGNEVVLAQAPDNRRAWAATEAAETLHMRHQKGFLEPERQPRYLVAETFGTSRWKLRHNNCLHGFRTAKRTNA